MKKSTLKVYLQDSALTSISPRLVCARMRARVCVDDLAWDKKGRSRLVWLGVSKQSGFRQNSIATVPLSAY